MIFSDFYPRTEIEFYEMFTPLDILSTKWCIRIKNITDYKNKLSNGVKR